MQWSADLAHNQIVVGSNPTPATIFKIMAKLKITNNWESYEYSVDKTPIGPDKIKRVKIKNKVYKTILKSYSVNYYDMGHTYTAHRNDLQITLKNELGFTQDISLIDIQSKFSIEVVDGSKKVSKRVSRKNPRSK